MSEDSVINAELLVEKLSVIGDVTSKKMFGGHGIFLNKKMFGMIDSKGKAFFKVDEELKQEFAKAGAEPHSKMPYMSVSEAVFEDTDLLVDWARKSTKLLQF